MQDLNRRTFLKWASFGAAAAAMPRWLSAAEKAPGKGPPNIVFVLADDLGYGDLECLNPRSRIPTPGFNQLAAQGMVFTDAHSGAAVCTPTRYGVVTGRYAWRTRLKRGVLGGYSTHLIDPRRLTVASLLQQHGYATACIGKWHLGMDFPTRTGRSKDVDFSRRIQNSPTRYGFDYYFGVSASLDMPPYVFIENDRFTELPAARQQKKPFPAFIRSGVRAPSFKPIETLDVLTRRATSYIAEKAKGRKPFFLYLALTAPHKPVMPAKRFENKSRLGPYGDFIMQVDWSVGQVAQALDRAGLGRDTLLIFTSDNGSFMFRLAESAQDDHVTKPGVQGYKPSAHTANHIFRGTKADIYEGGHHVPYIVRWPAKVKAGTTCDRTICLTDLMATCADLVGAALPDDAGEDSFSTVSLMLGKEPPTPRAPVVHHSANGTFAIRDGKWKLIFSTGSGGRQRPKGAPFGKPYRLFDLAADPSEATDVARKHPDVVERLTRALEKIRTGGRSRPAVGKAAVR